MLLIIKKKSLLKMLETVSQAIPTKSPDPNLLNFLITVTKEGLTVLGSDGDLFIKDSTLNKNSKGEDIIIKSKVGSVLVPAKITKDIISALTGEEVTLELIDTSVLSISDNKTNYNINTKPGNEYPDIEIGSSIGTEISVNSKDLVNLFNSTYFAANFKSTRPMFRGVNIKSGDGIFSLTATDGSRLSKRTVEIDSKERLVFTSPLKVLSIIKELQDEVDVINIKGGSDKVTFTLGSTVIGTKTIPGEFPDAEKITPPAFPYKLKCSGKAICNIIDRVSIMSDDDKNSSKIINLKYDGTKVLLNSKSQSYGNSTEEFTDCEFTGDKFQINFNATFVTQAIKAHDDDEIEIAFSGEARVFKINSSDKNNIQIVTPVRYF